MSTTCITHYCPCRELVCSAHHWWEATSTGWPHLHQSQWPQSSGVWRNNWTNPLQWHICARHTNMGRNIVCQYIHVVICGNIGTCNYNNYWIYPITLSLITLQCCHCGITLSFRISMQHWTKLKFSGASPCARYYHAACCIASPLTGQQHSLVMVVGGWGENPSLRTLDDVWLLDVDMGVWREVGTQCPSLYNKQL